MNLNLTTPLSIVVAEIIRFFNFLCKIFILYFKDKWDQDIKVSLLSKKSICSYDNFVLGSGNIERLKSLELMPLLVNYAICLDDMPMSFEIDFKLRIGLGFSKFMFKPNLKRRR